MDYKIILVEEKDRLKTRVEVMLKEDEELILSDFLKQKGFLKSGEGGYWFKEVSGGDLDVLKGELKLFQDELEKPDVKIFKQIFVLRKEFEELKMRLDKLEKVVFRIKNVLVEKKMLKGFDLFCFPAVQVPEVVKGFAKKFLFYKLPVWFLGIVVIIFLVLFLFCRVEREVEVVKEVVRVDSLLVRKADSLSKELVKVEKENQRLQSVLKDYYKKVVVYESLGLVVKKETLELYSEAKELLAEKQELEKMFFLMKERYDSLVSSIHLVERGRVKRGLGLGAFVGYLPKKDYFVGLGVRFGYNINVFGGFIYPKNKFFVGVGVVP